jgi:hypothetical protein
MGIETAVIVMASVAAGATVGKAAFEVEAANDKISAIDLQSKEIKLQSQQKTLANYDAMEKVIQAQQAHMTTTGTAFSSPSYNAIQRNTLNIGAKKGRNLETEEALEMENLEIEKRNVRNTLYAQLFGDVASLATSAASASAKMPTLAG